MWILTLYLPHSIEMFEFDNKDDARAKYDHVNGYKILSEVIYYNDFERVYE